ncbi:MAG TPA: phasin family protein [Gemmatimonadales bacterium]|nr:phasin family protein [Gemmatimonadales bacterium]
MPRTTRKTPVLTVRENAQHIWLAGLGALATAGEEGGRLFEQLVKKGSHIEKMNKARLANVLEKAQGRARALRGDAETAVERLAAPIDRGVSTALNKLGVPTRKEIMALTRRVEELTRTVEQKKAKARTRARRVAK